MTQTALVGGPRPQDSRPQDSRPQDSADERYLTFVLGDEVFALPILEITEIMEYRTLTVVPMMPAFIRVVINLRGRVVPVVDMAARFGRAGTDIARRTSIIIVEAARTAADSGADRGSRQRSGRGTENRLTRRSATGRP